MKSKRRSSKYNGKNEALGRLWAPWRIGYIQQNKKERSGCIFCSAFSPGNEQVVFRTGHAVAMVNIYPYNNGHLMVAPRRHVSDISSLSEEELTDMLRAIIKAHGLLKERLNPEGFNIGMNIGKAAGAGITDHIHMHIVPRWVGDTNFMPAVGSTKIISQALEELLSVLKE